MGRYRVTGSRSVFGFPPGSSFERDLSAAEEARKVRGGHLTVEKFTRPRPGGLKPDTGGRAPASTADKTSGSAPAEHGIVHAYAGTNIWTGDTKTGRTPDKQKEAEHDG